MTLFWISTVVLTLIACALVAMPLLKQKANNDEVLRDELNKAFYKDRLSELQEETEEGLVESQEDLISDLKQSLLDDIPGDKGHKETKISPIAVLVPSVVLTVVLSYGLYYQFGASQEVVRWQEVSANLPELSKKLMSSSSEPLSDQEMEDLTLALRTRLHYQPEDSTGWLLLGRIALANRDVTTAIDSMEKSYNLEPQDPDIMLGYAQALMLSQEEMDQNTARSLLGQLVQQDRVDLRVFSLLAFDAFERQDYPAAIKYWGVMQQMIGPEDSRYEMLSRSIDSARKQMGEAVSPDKSVAVTISLAPEAQVDPNGVLIVSVHRADGSPMPVAAARYPLASFPRTVVLDDGNAMMQGSKLSSLDKLLVRVRVDSDGNVATRDHDWHGESGVVEFGQPVEVIINKQF
ncbi:MULTISPECIES: c-type cytochrome biogenesis protein CcmI [Vibrio]|uniref:C-type cytochrome biogenesis protein CcmI n=1 Tax=Vibrio natriegens NBRC 15636 = ATCC 14048 = DSM 759 TaxID=1219067 RepID=A0AAN0Y4Q9_VIBNA|nr:MULTISPECIES: c-type cytochrome biogenesis protein CcmI [Vibrio]AEX22760.1 cytochrome c heme lyase subunit CcmH [Vibrio sp. EJY3]ALR14956.1 cytochrome C heme lyase [Vibrio natriegens NBRC 15636 = ATCC 14048 = DSM 759]ANQ13180.1 c-type cytochrome biogenesis protein CcmI [Vibrio natriegens NBRC 15636 = ATCC 14048 = DSM 759]EPM40654.1 cytochrome C heme lyase [Vibrio natriegens NBRC 15636 = ATCC 14048 = DSM 759]MDX6027610.1 c-type cytochrome biogenesis protein CcmI [Vibrio natriegens NBRC 15636